MEQQGTEAPDELVVLIPGEPVAQGRPRFSTRRGGAFGVVAIDPARSRSWKAVAQHHYLRALEERGLPRPFIPDGPVQVHVEAVWPCPRSDFRTRQPRPRRPMDRHRGDGSNVLKAVEDAANAVLWRDDCQIASFTLDRWIGAQGESPYVRVTVRPWRRTTADAIAGAGQQGPRD